MIDRNTSTNDKLQEWHLLAEFATTEFSELTDFLMNAIANLKLQPAQYNRILEEMALALDRAKMDVSRGGPLLPVRLRVLASTSLRAGSGCGFFLVAKSAQNNEQGSQGVTQLVDLYLYRSDQNV